jgi:hypothetical protein
LYTGLLKSKLSDQGIRIYSIHRLVAEYLYENLNKIRRATLHTRAAKYYEDAADEEVKNRFGGETLSYANWYRYENADWQNLQEERLYHLAHMDESGQVVTSAILRIFFDAFWWWGYYQPFAFCQALVDHWQQRIKSESVNRILKNLTAFRENYPPGDIRDKRRTSCTKNWERVRECLETLLKDTDLNRAKKSLDDNNLHIVGMINFFLAESYDHHAGRDFHVKSNCATQYYQYSLTAFTDLQDDWNASWMSFYFAESIAPYDKDLAMKNCLASIDLAEKAALNERDPEILGNVYRLIGDIHIKQDQFDDAIKSYQKASFYAYAFQGIPNPPDEYTIAFYREIIEKISSAICDLSFKRHEIGQHLLNSLDEYWEPYWTKSESPQRELPDDAIFLNTERVIRYLFPSLPPIEDIKSRGAAFQAEVRENIDLLSRTDTDRNR